MKHLRHFIPLMIMLFLVSFAAHASERNGPDIFNYAKAYFYNFYSVYPQNDGEVWVVGSGGIICKLDKKIKKWIVYNAGTDSTLYNIKFVGKKLGWIVAQRGLILHTSDGGKTWVRQKSNTKEHLFSVSFADESNGWIVGAYGTILHTSDGGATWKQQVEKVDKIYNYVYFTDKDYGWVVGEFGTILHTRDGGVTWKQQKNPLGEKTLFSVFFEDHMRGWITGMDGSILKTENGGEKWEVVKTPIKEHLFSIEVIGDSGWTVGLKGVYGINHEGKWIDSTTNMPTRAWLKQCAFLNKKIGWVVGSVGTILYTSDGGKSWHRPWNMKNLLPANSK